MARGFSSILGACRTGTREQVSAFIKAGADVNAKGKDGWTPLSLAADFNPNADVITVLIEAGADIDARDIRSSTALMWAASMNPNPDVIAALVKGGADVNAADDDGRTPLFFAAGDNPNSAVVAALISADAHVNAATSDGKTPLMAAAQNCGREGNGDAIAALAAAGADVNAKGGFFGWTPLMWATKDPNTHTIVALLKNGADPNAKDNGGKTALYWARIERNPVAIKVLADAGQPLSDEDNIAQTPQSLADWGKQNPDFVAAIAEARAQESGQGTEAQREERDSITMNFGLDVNESGELSLTINSNNQERPKSAAPNDFPPSILFTGFKAADRTRLEKLAVGHNYVVRKSVSHFLTFVVGGDNAGPAKIANAKHEGATALTEAEFMRLLYTGELP